MPKAVLKNGLRRCNCGVYCCGRPSITFVLANVIAADNILAINVIESPQLRDIFLMLRAELKDSNIPHHTTIKKHVEEVLTEHLDRLRSDMAVRLVYPCSLIVVAYTLYLY